MMRIGSERLLKWVAVVSASFSLFVYMFSLLSSSLVSNLLLTAILLVLLFLSLSRVSVPFYSPMFFYPLVFLILLLTGVFSFNIIYGRSLASGMTEYIYAGFLGLFIGVSIGQQICTLFVNFKHSQMRGTPNVPFLYIIVFFGFAAFVTMVAIKGLPVLASDIDEAKVQFYSGLGHLNIVYGLLPIATIAILADGLIKGNRKRVKIAHCIFLLILLTNATTGFRSLVIKNVISYAVFLGIFQEIKLSKVKIFLYAVVTILLASIVGAYRRGNEGLSGIINELGITIGARPKAAELIFLKLDAAKGIGFSYLGDLAKLLPGSQTGQNVELKFLIFNNADKMADIGGINPSIIGEALLAGGRGTVFLAPLLLGLFTATLYSFAVRRTSKLFWPLLYAILVSDLLGALASGIATRLPSLLIQSISVVVILFVYSFRLVPTNNISGPNKASVTR